MFLLIHESLNLRYLRHHLDWKHALDLLLSVHAIVHKLEKQDYETSECQTDAEAHSAKLQSVWKVRLRWNARRIQHRESFTLLHVLHAGGHDRLILFLQ